MGDPSERGAGPRASLWQQLRERGVLRVAFSYGVIAWLVLQIADVVLDPLGVPRWVMTALILAAAAGFPLAILLAWFLEVGASGVTVDTAPVGATRPAAQGWRHHADVVVIGALLVTVVVLAVRQSDLGKPKPPANPAIAVLPFENPGGDPAREYFSDGLAEEMLDRLGRVPGLRVIARSSSFSFKGSGLDAREIAGKLDVTTLLEGSVRRDGRRLRLTARLIDGATGQQVWSGSFDREMGDIFAVQRELAAAVVDAVIPAARGSTDTAPPPTTDLDAYDLYLLARTQLAVRTADSIRKAVELSEQAVQLDPKFARAHALLASSLLFERLFENEVSEQEGAELLRRAETSIHRALALDPDLSEAYGAYANLLRDTARPGAEDAYKRAIDLNPNNATAWHDYSVFLVNDANRPEESVRTTERSLELDPRQPVTWANYLTNVVARQGRERFEQEMARAVRTVGDMPGALARFPVMIWAEDRIGYHVEFAKLERQSEGRPGALDGELLPGATIPGFPVEILRGAIGKPRQSTPNMAPVWVHQFRAWLPVDPARAAAALETPADGTLPRGLESARAFLLVDIAGRLGDPARLDQALAALRDANGDDQPQVRSVMAFWLAARGRYAEASRWLAGAEPLQARSMPPVLGGDTDWGLLETAKARILRETGRADEASRLLEATLAQRPKVPASKACDYQSWPTSPVRYASLLAEAGHKEAAVDDLRLAMRCGDLPFGFEPGLPWFRSLEGYAPYDELVKERARRIAEIRPQLEQIETRIAAGPP